MVRSECADRDTVVGLQGPERGRAGRRAAQWHSVERTNSGKADTARHGPVGAGRTDLPACSVRRPWSMVAAGSPRPGGSCLAEKRKTGFEKCTARAYNTASPTFSFCERTGETPYS